MGSANQLLSEAMVERNKCREGLIGAMVIAGDDEPRAITSTTWGKDSTLLLTLDDGEMVTERDCRLALELPPPCAMCSDSDD